MREEANAPTNGQGSGIVRVDSGDGGGGGIAGPVEHVVHNNLPESVKSAFVV